MVEEEVGHHATMSALARTRRTCIGGRDFALDVLQTRCQTRPRARMCGITASPLRCANMEPALEWRNVHREHTNDALAAPIEQLDVRQQRLVLVAAASD